MTKAAPKHLPLLAAIGVVALGCSEIAPGDEDYCDVNPGVGPCATAEAADPQWWCLDTAPGDLPDVRQNQFVGFVLPAVDWNTSAPLAGNGLVATLCGGIDPACSQPLNTTPIEALTALGAQALPPGAAGLPLPEGFRGVIKFDVRRDGRPENEQYITTRYHMGGAALVDPARQPDGIMRGAPILMLQRGLAETTVRESFPLTGTPEQTLSLAALAFGVYDCNGDVVPNARIEIKQGGVTPTGLLPFQLPASFIPVTFQPDTPLVTDVSGQVGYLNVPTGSVQLTAYQTLSTGQERIIGRAEMGAVGGQFSVGVIRPAYFLDADVRGAPEPTNAGGPRAGG